MRRDSRSAPRTRRIRRTAEASQEVALTAARALLVSGGPPAVTLKGVALATGMTHGNVTHHFGTSAALHEALIGRLAAELSAQSLEAVLRLRRGEIAAPDVVDAVFSAFVTTGCGRLIGWLSASGGGAALEPIFAALRASVQTFRAGEPGSASSGEFGAGPIALELFSHALTASLVGENLEAATGMPDGSLRRLAAARLDALRATARL
ncbi:TetR/AcrR family transcriptional regulator [Methylobacterium sp. A54F]